MDRKPLELWKWSVAFDLNGRDFPTLHRTERFFDFSALFKRFVNLSGDLWYYALWFSAKQLKTSIDKLLATWRYFNFRPSWFFLCSLHQNYSYPYPWRCVHFCFNFVHFKESTYCSFPNWFSKIFQTDIPNKIENVQ